MKTDFQDNEKLYRGIKRKQKFIKRDLTVSRHAFDYTGSSTGCSVARQLDRPNEEAVKHTLNWLKEYVDIIVSIKVEVCNSANVYIEHIPSKSNYFHSEMFQNKKKEKLNDEQLDFLAENCVLEKIKD